MACLSWMRLSHKWLVCWGRIAAWKSKYLEGRRSGEVVHVKLKTGHPERHKSKCPSGRDVHDKGMFLADEFHTIGGFYGGGVYS